MRVFDVRPIRGRAGRAGISLLVLIVASAAGLGACAEAPTPAPESTAEVSAEDRCPDLTNAKVELSLNELHQVWVRWQAEGGCPPFQGRLRAWYQDEPEPDHIFQITQSSGELLDTPVLHFGSWDRDYYLEIVDASGQRILAMGTIGVGR